MRVLCLAALSLVLVVSPSRADDRTDADARAALALSLARPPQAPLPPQAPVRTDLRWEAFSDGDPTQVKLMLYADGSRRQVGVWVHATQTYYPVQGGRLSETPSLPPIPPPARPAGASRPSIGPSAYFVSPVASWGNYGGTGGVFCGPRG